MFLALGFERVQLRPEVVQFRSEIAYPLVGLLLLGGVELLLGQVVVFVDGAVECRQGGRERAERGGREVRGVELVRGEGGEVFADRGALLES